MEQDKIKDELDSVSYALGVNVGINIINKGMKDVNTEAMFKGINDVLLEKELAIPEQEYAKTLNDYIVKNREMQNEKILRQGKAYMEENAKRGDVTTTASGLQYEVVKAGTGAKPSATDKVTVHYRGTLLNGTEFDSSYKRGEPTTFPLNKVIPGWTEGLQLMKEGAKYKFTIPPELAYGVRGTPDGRIPGNSTLLFGVELISVEQQGAGK